jgi:hypothetical protein
MKGDEDLQAQLQNALAKCSRLREENARLQRLIPDSVSRSNESPESAEGKHLDRSTATTSDLVRNSSSPETKVALFRSLFRGREDVYAVRWEGKNGRSGYSPAGIREWSPTPRENSNLRPAKYKFKMQSYFPVTDNVIRDHLIGTHTVGIYPLLLDDTCHLLAADFDKKSWKEDALAYLHTCSQFEVPAALERSRSGNGGHVWILFPKVFVSRVATSFISRSEVSPRQCSIA